MVMPSPLLNLTHRTHFKQKSGSLELFLLVLEELARRLQQASI